jgi:hypothetical protein
MENNIRPVVTPEDAIAQFVGEQYMEWLMNYIDHDVKTWASLNAIAQAKSRPEKIKKFMLQRFLAAEAFTGGREGDPGFLGFAVANLSESSDPLAENALELVESKRKEEVSGVGSAAEQSANIHRLLWVKLLKALEAGDDEIKRIEAKEPTRNYIAELSDVYSNAEWQTTMAAFAAHEKLIPQEYTAIIAMLQNNTQLSPADLEVLTWHSKGDAKYVIEASHILERAVVDEEGKTMVFEGVKRQLDARRDFYDSLAKYLYEI